jgi:hypothetical protein
MAGQQFKICGDPLATLNVKLKIMKLRLEVLKLTYLILCLLKLMNK